MESKRLCYLVAFCYAVMFLLVPGARAQTGLFSATPLMDMPQPNNTCLTYKGFAGGLYENCSDSVPSDHDADGKAFASQIVPLNASGTPSASGKVVLESIGMSAALSEFSEFLAIANKSSQVNHKTLYIGNGAESDMNACTWFPAFGLPSCNFTTQNQYDRISASLASGPRLTPSQVQVVWIDQGNGRVHPQLRGCLPEGTECVPLCNATPAGCNNTTYGTDALNLEQELGDILRAAKERWPNLKMAFFSGRIYGGYAIGNGDDTADPEPYAYEVGYAVKWLIEAQILQIRTGTIDPVAGDLGYDVAPWLGWGWYTWADGPIPRSDGLVWCDGQPGPPCNGELDFGSDGLHPTIAGATKVSNILMNFFLNSPYSKSWFAASPGTAPAK